MSLFSRGRRRAATVAAVAAAILLPAPPATAHTPHDIVEAVAVSPDFANDATVFVVAQLSEHAVLARSFDGGRTWQEHGLEMVQHGVTSLRFSPDYATDGTAFGTTVTGGVFRSVDQGATWTAVNAGLSTLDVRDIAISPDFAIDGKLVIATDAGCYTSGDGGDNWASSSTGLAETSLQRVTFAPEGSSTSTLFMGGKVLHRSVDGGASWTPRASFATPIAAVATSPAYLTDETLAVATDGGTGIQVSTDAGRTFAASDVDLLDLFVTDVVFADDGTLVASTETLGVFTSAGPFLPWTISMSGVEAPALGQATQHYTAVAPSPDFGTDGVLFVGAFHGLFQSSDRGSTWRQADLFHLRINRTFAVSPDYANDRLVAVGNFGGGMLVTTDAGQSWTPGLDPGATPPAPVGSPGSAGTSSASGATPEDTSSTPGTTPNPVPPRSPREPAPEPMLPVPGIAWEARADGITSLYPGPVVISPTVAVDDTMFFAHVGLWRSTDRGKHWTKLDIDPTITVVRSVGLSPTFATDGILFFGTSSFGSGTPSKGIWKSVDGGDTFQLSDTGIPSNLKVRDFQFSPDWPADPTIYLAGRNLGVFRSLDGGTNWEEVNNGLSVMIMRVLRISPDYSRDTTLFAGTAGGGLFVSHDGGENWAPANAGLPDLAGIDVEGIAISPEYATDRTLFITTQRSGVWRSEDGAATWQPVNDGLPLDMPRFIEPSPDFGRDRTLFLSTHDWMWRSVNAGQTWHRLPGFVRVPDDHPLMVYNVLWERGAIAGTHGGGVRKSRTAGDWFEYSFHGDSVQWLVTRDDSSGMAEVMLDGQLVDLVDLYSDVAQNQRVAWSAEFAEAGWHTVRVEVTGQANGASSDVWVHSDGISFTF